MKTKLMTIALLLCSAISFAGDLSTAPAPEPKKKASKIMIAPSSASSEAQPAEGAGLGGLGTAGTAARPKAKPRGTAPAPQKQAP